MPSSIGSVELAAAGTTARQQTDLKNKHCWPSYPATSRGDRRTKAHYLLTVEARGELDLEEHMQAILHSMMQG